MSENLFRVLAAIILISSSAISIYYRRKANLDSGEKVSTKAEGGPMFLALRLTALTAFICMIAYLINPAWMTWSRVDYPEPVRWLAVGIGFLGVIFCYWIFSTIGKGISTTVATRTQATLVKSGPYRWVRHPLYVVGLFMFGAIGVIAENWLITGLIIVAFLLLTVRTKDEEKHLIAKFGDEYREYMKTTGRYLPKLF